MNGNLPKPQPWIIPVDLTPPCLGNNTADADRLVLALKHELKTGQIRIDLSLMRDLPGILRDAGWHLRCVVFKEHDGFALLDVFPPDEVHPVAGGPRSGLGQGLRQPGQGLFA